MKYIRYEYKAARFLFEKYGVISFPAPDETYDLITLDDIRIEVKSRGSALLTPNQREIDAFDLFMVASKGMWVFILQREILLSIHPNRISIKCMRKASEQLFESWDDVISLFINPA